MDPNAAIFCKGRHLQEIFSLFAASSSLEIQPILNAQQFVDFPSSEQFCAANYDALSVDGIPP
jgi:hypothetical protein